jgi:hypothetical protein
LALASYRRFEHLLVDQRVTLDDQAPTRTGSRALEDLSWQLFERSVSASFDARRDLGETYRILGEIETLVPQPTALSIADFRTGWAEIASRPDPAGFGRFHDWWGRGQQHVCFQRRLSRQDHALTAR